MHINADSKEIYLNGDESDVYARKDFDERAAYVVRVTRQLHAEHPGLPRDTRFEVVNSSNVLLFFVFTY